MNGYDIIGDIHGCASDLLELLAVLGYEKDSWTGAFICPEGDRKVIFVGDLVDRGPQIRRTLEIAKGMVDAGSALIVMGNHEFNAVAYATRDPKDPDRWLRKHTANNNHQHLAFLEQLSRRERAMYVAWFKTLPLFLDLGGVRVVHACWHEPTITRLRVLLGGDRFRSLETFAAASPTPERRGELYRLIETTLKGPEVAVEDLGLPAFHDLKSEKDRHHARIAWWNSQARTIGDLVVVPDPQWRAENAATLAEPIPDGYQDYAYSSSVPVVYGHYWRSPDPAEHHDYTATTACVDFSAVRGGHLMAYRWNEGETTINPDHYVRAEVMRP